MSDNMFADAIASKPVSHTTEVPNHPHFFQHTIDAQVAARNMTRQQMFNKGLITVSDLDDEELRHGRCRDASGKIPKVTKTLENIPRDLYDEMVAEHHRRLHELYRQHLDDALNTFVEIMTDDSQEAKDRMEAAKQINERVLGKPQERVAVSVTKEPWEQLLGDVAHITRQQHLQLKEGYIEGEVVDLPGQANGDVGPVDGEAHAHSPMDNLAPPGQRVPTPPVPKPEGGAGQALGQEPNAVQDGRKPPDARPEQDQALLHDRGQVVDDQQQRPVRDGRGEFSGPNEPRPIQPWDDIVPAPSHIEPAMSNPVAAQTLSEQLAAAAAKQAEVAEARANRRKLIDEAKRKRRAKREVGANVLVKNIDAEAFERAQDRLSGNTLSQDERDTGDPG